MTNLSLHTVHMSPGTTEDLTGETHTEEILNGYAPFKVRLNYKTATPPDGPFYILIMASSSRYGDYFTGSTSSVMYVDEFSLDYNYDAEAFSGTTLGKHDTCQYKRLNKYENAYKHF